MTLHLVTFAAAVGTWWRPSIGVIPVVIVVAMALRTRRSLVVGLAVVLLAGWWSARAVAGFQPPPAGPVDGWVILTSDPRPSGPVGAQWLSKNRLLTILKRPPRTQIAPPPPVSSMPSLVALPSTNVRF